MGIVVGAVVLLLVVAAVAVSLLFDPNDYKDEITAAVQDATGRQLTLDGDLELALFPTIRIAVGGATLCNAPGFGDEPMARIGSASCASRLLPLLSQRIEISRGRASRASSSTSRATAAARNNWQDLGGGRRRKRDAPAARWRRGGAGDLDLGVGAIEIADARIVWNDASTGSRWELTDFGLTCRGLRAGPSVSRCSMDFALAGADVAVKVAADMQATLAIATNEYRLEQLAVTIDGSGAGGPAARARRR